MRLLRLLAAAAALTVLALPIAAHAADPVMPLSAVQPGMHCIGYSVIHGVDISGFDVDVVDILVDGPNSAVLVRVSGAAVDDTGIAEGFSGSPVYCPDGAGGSGVIGAIAQGTGDYGGKLVIVTPIEQMLGEPVDPPASAVPMPRALRASRRPLATPLTFGGVSGPVAGALRLASRKTGRQLYAAPAAPRAASFPVQTLQPGSSVAVGLAGGDLSAGAVGTVTYVDGDKVWAFGHPLDAAGRRSLLLQDAWVFAVVGNPIDTQDITSYKLAAPGHDIGTLTNDAIAGVVGRLGVLPDRFPLRVIAKDEDSGKSITRTVEIADENGVGQPTGTSSLTMVAPVAVAQTAFEVLRGSPVRQSGEMCMRIVVRERPKPLRFCNTYVGGSAGAAGAPMASDVAAAGGILDAYNFGVLHVTSVDVNLKLRRDLRQAFLLRADVPSVVRRGHDLRVKLTAQRVRGEKLTRTFSFHVPRSTPAGERELVFTGTSADAGGSDSTDALASIFDIVLDVSGAGDERGPTSLKALAKSVADLHRDDGVTASFHDPDAGPEDDSDVPELDAYRDKFLRLSGTVRRRVLVVG